MSLCVSAHLIRRIAVIGLSLGAGSVLAACSSMGNSELADVMGDATPVESPVSRDADGEILSDVFADGTVIDIEHIGNILAVRGEDSLAFGTVEQFQAGQSREVAVDKQCGELTANSETFVLACGEKVIEYSGPEFEAVETAVDPEYPATSAVRLTTGELLTANSDSARVVLYKGEEKPHIIEVEKYTTQLLSSPVDDGPDAVIRTLSEDTTIQDIDWSNGKQGARLRVGLGIGRVAPGPDGLFLASDTTGGQLMVYTADDVIRLHQAGPVDESPWAVAWDPHRNVAWVASTANNLATAYDISTGVQQPEFEIRTVADARSMVVLADGTIVTGSATGDGLQIISEPRSSTKEKIDE
ncbi:hypothetical protein ATK06_1828 [Corynebacterium renale]|uniref:Prolipoprotein LppL n=2 Tax=Corynebacterium renale TaxID=1724 RepID=A0A2A9DPT9_9CORY|nr:hypothetical protein ATK06_1828 [Corynebacterium renale]